MGANLNIAESQGLILLSLVLFGFGLTPFEDVKIVLVCATLGIFTDTQRKLLMVGF